MQYPWVLAESNSILLDESTYQAAQHIFLEGTENFSMLLLNMSHDLYTSLAWRERL